jgi:Chromo (CHRromatin Organisation MOdifier) domain
MSAKASKVKAAMLAAMDDTFREEMANAIEALTGLKPGADADGLYLIKEIMKRKTLKDGSFVYLIRWLGWSASDDSCEPFENLNDYAQEHVIDRWCRGRTPRSFVGQYDHILLEHFEATIQEARQNQEVRAEEDNKNKKPASKNVVVVNKTERLLNNSNLH